MACNHCTTTPPRPGYPLHFMQVVSSGVTSPVVMPASVSQVQVDISYVETGLWPQVAHKCQHHDTAAVPIGICTRGTRQTACLLPSWSGCDTLQYVVMQCTQHTDNSSGLLVGGFKLLCGGARESSGVHLDAVAQPVSGHQIRSGSHSPGLPNDNPELATFRNWFSGLRCKDVSARVSHSMHPCDVVGSLIACSRDGMCCTVYTYCNR